MEKKASTSIREPAGSTQGSPTPGPDPHTTQSPTINRAMLGPITRRPTRVPSPITSNDFDLTQATAGSKHGREEFEDIDKSVSKCRKSDDMFTMATKFTNRSCPAARKLVSKGPKLVSDPQFLLILCADTVQDILYLFFFVPMVHNAEYCLSTGSWVEATAMAYHGVQVRG
jgi:hypothetical protein